MAIPVTAARGKPQATVADGRRLAATAADTRAVVDPHMEVVDLRTEALPTAAEEDLTAVAVITEDILGAIDNSARNDVSLPRWDA